MNAAAATAPRNGARWLAHALEAEGVDTLFGYPGGTIMPFYDALVDSNLKHILVRHEQGAALAANGYARASGKVGVCVATSGPGASDRVTGIADAILGALHHQFVYQGTDLLHAGPHFYLVKMVGQAHGLGAFFVGIPEYTHGVEFSGLQEAAQFVNVLVPFTWKTDDDIGAQPGVRSGLANELD